MTDNRSRRTLLSPAFNALRLIWYGGISRLFGWISKLGQFALGLGIIIGVVIVVYAASVGTLSDVVYALRAEVKEWRIGAEADVARAIADEAIAARDADIAKGRADIVLNTRFSMGPSDEPAISVSKITDNLKKNLTGHMASRQIDEAAKRMKSVIFEVSGDDGYFSRSEAMRFTRGGGTEQTIIFTKILNDYSIEEKGSQERYDFINRLFYLNELGIPLSKSQ